MGSVGNNTTVSTSTKTIDINKYSNIKLSPTAQQALELSILWINRARESKNIEEFVAKIPTGFNLPENYKETYEDLKNGVVWSAERRFNKTLGNTNKLFAKQAASNLVKAGIAEKIAENNNGMLIKIK